jgi:hypothetical protein
MGHIMCQKYGNNCNVEKNLMQSMNFVGMLLEVVRHVVAQEAFVGT